MSAPDQRISEEDPTTAPVRLRERFAEVREAAREQIEAAWSIHVNSVQEELSRGWRQHIAAVFEERFAELAETLEAEVERRTAERVAGELDAALAGAERAVCRELGDHLGQAARRLREAETEAELEVALLDAAARFAGRSALLLIEGQRIRLHGRRGFADSEPAGEVEIHLADSPAIQGVVDELDCFVAIHSSGELSGELVRVLPAGSDARVTLVPVVRDGRAVAIVYAENGVEPVDVNTIESLTTLAGLALEVRMKTAVPELVSIMPAVAPAHVGTSRSALTPEQEEQHGRAQRVARVQVAEIRLYQSTAVKEGRAAGDLYGRLKTVLDAGRDSFHREFCEEDETMIDYYHQELVRTLANDDESLLGPDYPGPLA